MKLSAKAAGIAAIAGMCVYAVAFLIGYRYLLARQPPHQEGVPMPLDFTSFPPSAAWRSAFDYGLSTFAIIFLLALIVFRIRQYRPRDK